MRLKSILFVVAIAMSLAACKGKQDYSKKDNYGHTNDELKLTGDKTVYGLACEGCTDSVIVLLPNDGSDPVKYDIIDAFRDRHVIGRPTVGDWIGLVINKQDKKTADLVIDLDQLKGTWCYKVMPKMKARSLMSKRLRARILANIPDSIKQKFMVPREYGFSIKSHWTASPLASARRQNQFNEDSPIVYPPVTYYTAWHILNGKLVLTHGTIRLSGDGNDITYTNLKNDTAEFVFMSKNMLGLKFNDKVTTYYRQGTKPIIPIGKTDKDNRYAKTIAQDAH